MIKKIKESDETLKSWVVQRDKLSLKYFKEDVELFPVSFDQIYF